MDSLIVVGAALVMSGALNVFLVFALKSAMRDMKELAREGLLAARAESAGDLATASLVAHQAAAEREQAPDKKAKHVSGPAIPVLQGRDGRPIFPMRPVG